MTIRRRTAAALLVAGVVALAGCGSPGAGVTPATAGAVTASGPADAQTVTVVGNNDLKFAPQTVYAKVGTLTITLRITGGVPHDLKFDDGAVGAAIPVTTDSSTQTYTFNTPGTYGFVCTIHSGMVGQVVVR